MDDGGAVILVRIDVLGTRDTRRKSEFIVASNCLESLIVWIDKFQS